MFAELDINFTSLHFNVQCYSHTYSLTYHENWYIFDLIQKGNLCHIDLFDLAGMLHVTMEEETYFDFDT